MTIFYLVRHGVTSHTGHRLSGRMPDIHLSDAGRGEAEVAATSLVKVRLKSIYSSPIDRCIETARTIADKHGLPVRTRKDLAEVEYGTWTNKSLKTVARTKLWSSVQKWPAGTRFPEGESFVEIQSRGVAVLEDLRTRHPKDRICVVSHGDVIRLVMAHYMGIHLDLFQRILITPASISVLSVTDSGPVVLTLNAPPGSPLGG
ncbi:MAG TPA: MSMEG_4193 family putative phosphomutase [Actinomycetota bacterium]|nr:MSMEG_4193 family putative phosphomutase [Actinomycetota bacterium]